jgi:hypothetical protein
MKPDPDRDWLDDALAEGLRDPIVENGFPRRVMAALPPARSRNGLRLLILLGATMVACFLGLWVVPGGAFVFSALSGVFSLETWTNPLAIIASAAILGCVAAWLAWAAASAEV